MIGNNPVSDQNKAMGKAAGPMKKGGRTKRADGGDAIADYLNKNPEQPRGMPGRGLPATGAPIYHGAEDKHNFMPDTNLTTQGKKKGGKIKHPDVAEDKALIKRMVKPEARTGRKSGGGIFSGNSKQKNPGEVGGRKARRDGGRDPSDTSNTSMPMANYNFLTGWSDLDKATPDQIAAMKPQDRQAALAAQGPSRGVMPAAVPSRSAASPSIMRSTPDTGMMSQGMMDPAQRAAMNAPVRVGGTPNTGAAPTQSITQPSGRTQNYSLPFVHMGGAGAVSYTHLTLPTKRIV